MDEKTKLHLALIQVENCISLLTKNQYGHYMCGKLHPVKYEIKRQIELLTNSNNYIKIEQ